MTIIEEGNLAFVFDSSCQVVKYDKWSFYIGYFQHTCKGAKAVDFICLNDDTCWFIEVKDYRRNNCDDTYLTDLADKVASKVRDSLAALFVAKMNAKVEIEKDFANKATSAKSLKVVLHLEQPEICTKLHPQAINPVDVLQSLCSQLRAIDPNPRIVNKRTLSPDMTWTVRDKP